MPDDVYLGNPNLKKANTPIEFTQEQVLEFVKCKDDPVYFAKNYVCLLYTSPSPRDVEESRMPSSA